MAYVTWETWPPGLHIFYLFFVNCFGNIKENNGEIWTQMCETTTENITAPAIRNLQITTTIIVLSG